jgi:hypothetical protein
MNQVLKKKFQIDTLEKQQQNQIGHHWQARFAEKKLLVISNVFFTQLVINVWNNNKNTMSVSTSNRVEMAGQWS